MTEEVGIQVIFDALGLPPEARVDARVPKKLLVEQGAPTPADKRAIQEGIDELHWLAVCKPATIGVPAFVNNAREYLEVAVVSCVFRLGAKAGRLVELIHRAIPYPVLLINSDVDGLCVSVAHKRHAQNEAGKVIIESVVSVAGLKGDAPDSPECAFTQSLALAQQPRRDLFTLYNGWLARIEALIRTLFGVDLFAFPKPTQLIAGLIEQVAADGDIVLDFFAGSGTTGHAVWKQNAADNVNRRYILVQLPEPLDPSNREQKVASDFCDSLKKPRTISELTKERLRRSAMRVGNESALFKGDVGFRVFKLAPSNIRAWEPDAANLENSLLKNAEHLVQGRTEQDVLYELLLKLGLDLCVPVERKTIAGMEIHSIGAGALIVCLANGLTKEVVEPLSAGIIAWRNALAPAVDTRVVFKDSGFADDIAKTNMAAILNQSGISDVRSL